MLSKALYVREEAGTQRYNIGTDTPKLCATSRGRVPLASNFLAASTLLQPGDRLFAIAKTVQGLKIIPTRSAALMILSCIKYDAPSGSLCSSACKTLSCS